MSGRFRHEIRIDADVFIISLRQYSHEEIGLALRIVVAVAFNPEILGDDDWAQGSAVGVYSVRTWRRLRPRAMAAAAVLWESTEIKVRGIRDPIPPWIRAEVFDRDGYKCSYCETEDGPFELDHIIPVARGGENLATNLCVSCSPCNRSKRDKLLSEWLK